ncbi:hypothetical protein ICM05_09835 [Leucobacter sp. cx-42]|uniref:hypothetical protein n=1 Tax=unclassified Leucobacter TaxID=2621730 RepID=UPI00165E2F7B|nr:MULTISPECIES: hypothetical protein [unclassified Leucobacter]MBC9954937.1 hypothetical protein [Leucobacter sp. cx-42]
MATRLDAQYKAQIRQVRQATERFAVKQWDGLGSWRDADFERLATKLSPRIEAGQQRIADLTDSYIRKQTLAEFGTIKQGVAIRATTLELRGVPVEAVLHRPFVAAYTALGQGKTMSAALAAGRERMTDVVRSGSQLAKTHAAAETLSRSKFLGFQRVLSGSENCALCVVASTQRYHVGDLLPIHPGCDCDVKPLHGELDRQVIDRALLDDTYAEIATRLDHVDVGLDARNLGLNKRDANGRPLSDFTDLLITREHGELGPVLAWRDQKFTSARDLAALA